MSRQNDTPRHAALYIRVSTDAQREEGYSIEAQREMLEAYCVSKQIRNTERYEDGGFSGSNVQRPAMQRLIADVKAGRVSHVIVYKLDRLSRSQKDTLYLIEDVFNPAQVSFVSLNENMDTATPIGRAMLGIMSAFAQLERETIRERTRMGMRERVKSGLWMGGGRVPFGYDYDPEKGILVPNENAETVRQVYRLYLAGYSLSRIARVLGLRYERLAEQILKRKTNCGVIYYNGVEYEGQHEAIVPRAVYEQAMAEMERRSRHGLTPSRQLLAGLLVCGVCGTKMRYQKWGKAGYKIYCYSQDKGKRHISHGDPCSNEKVWADEVEHAVIEDLFAMAERNCAPSDPEQQGGRDFRRAAQSRVEALQKKLRVLYSLYAEQEDAILLKTLEKVRDELKRAEAELDEWEKRREQENAAQTAFCEIHNLRDAWDYLSLTEKQALVRRCVEKIVITGHAVRIDYRLE